MSLRLRAEAVSYAWPAGALAVKELSADFAAGEANIVAGPSGSGKSTLALLLAGLVKPQEGSIIRPEIGPAATAHEVAYVFQSPETLFVADTVREEFTEFGGEFSWEVGCEWLAKAGIAPSPISGTHPFHLSVGVGRVVALTLQLARSPRVLIVDEPSISLDWKFRTRVSKLLLEWISPTRILIVITHDLELMRTLGGTSNLLLEGQIRWTGSTADLLNNEGMLQEFDLI